MKLTFDMVLEENNCATVKLESCVGSCTRFNAVAKRYDSFVLYFY